jgi:hypothetical protein
MWGVGDVTARGFKGAGCRCEAEESRRSEGKYGDMTDGDQGAGPDDAT